MPWAGGVAMVRTDGCSCWGDSLRVSGQVACPLCLLSANITDFPDPSDPLVQAGFPLHPQGLKKSRKKTPSSAHSGLQRVARTVPPIRNAFPLPTSPLPSFRAMRSLPLPCHLPGHSSPKNPLLSWVNWTKSILAASTEDFPPPHC